ncbi:MAG TPA: hypothetical protein DHM44_02465 [Flexistipes sinusarabici]|uniref:Uncharacterized protein n=1 Tax=Flexistipes sinusarabici TaxID=2352 RepID=A0A3D5QA27_FLESI|nr:hypothetical protein [Flexistipes sinusarabici]
MLKKQGQPRVLTPEVISKIHYYLELNNSIGQVCDLLGLKIDTVKRAIKEGRIPIPERTQNQTESSTKSERGIIDNDQAMGKACSNSIERVLSIKTGESCPVTFSNQTDLQHAGVLISLPALLAQGLLRYKNEFALENVYYPTSSVFLSLAILSLLRIKTLSGAGSLPSGELGRTIGLDRIPEVKTLRARIAEFCQNTAIDKWRFNLSRDWMADSPELSAVLYIDGHINLYYGKETAPPKRFVSRMRLCLSGTTDYWVNDAIGQPFFVINKTISPGLISSIKEDLLDRFDRDVPNQPGQEELSKDKFKSRYMLVFDREGYSPDLFYDLWQKRVSIATYKKHVADKWDETEFAEYTGKLPFGNEKSIELAERGVLLQNKGSRKKIWAREIRKKSKSGHQTSIITTNFTLPIIMIGLYMFARWSQENFFKYMMQEFGIDTLVSYMKEKISDTSVLVNPQYRALENQRKKLTSKLNTVKAKFSSLILADTPIEKKEMEKYLLKKEALKTEIEQRETEIEQVKAEKKTIPRKIAYSELPEVEKFDNVVNERKHFLDTIKIIAYRAETALSNIIKQDMSHEDESRLLLKQVYKTDANIKVDQENKRLVVEIHRLAYRKDDKILEKLCHHMNETQMQFPDAELTLYYKLVSS